MKIVLISMVRNEADVIEIFSRYHAEFADELLIADHHSLDDTKEILSELAVEGLPIRIFEIEEAAFDQAKQLTLLMKQASVECGADWVLPLDADEFLTSATDAGIHSAIEQLPSTAPAQVSWRTYVPTNDDPIAEPHLFRRITYRRDTSIEVHKKILVPGTLSADPRTYLTHGNHRLLKKAWRKPKKIVPIETPDLTIAHFPLRTVDQAIVKGLVTWPSSLANSSARPEKHWNQQRMFNEILRGQASSADWLTRFASTYAQTAATDDDADAPLELVHDPIVERIPIELRWPNPGTITALAAVSEMAERLGGRLGELRRNEKS